MSDLTKWIIGIAILAIAALSICVGGEFWGVSNLLGSDPAPRTAAALTLPGGTAEQAPLLEEEVVFAPVPSGTASDASATFVAINAENAVCDPIEESCRIYDTREATWGHGLFVEGVERRGVCASRNGGAAMCLVAKATGKVVGLDCLPADPRVASEATENCPAFEPTGAHLPDAVAIGDETPTSD